MRTLSIICFLIGIAILPFSFMIAIKPSAIPIASVIGAFIVPALFIWWGVIFGKKASAENGITDK